MKEKNGACLPGIPAACLSNRKSNSKKDKLWHMKTDR